MSQASQSDNRSRRPPQKQVLCIWLPNWPIQRVQAAEPQLARAPLVLTDRDSRRGLVVVSANLAARAAGIRPTMRLSEATALTETEIREHDPHEDIDSLCHLTEQAQQFSPIVGLEQLDKKPWSGRTLLQPESILLDITGIAGLFGGQTKLMHRVGEWLTAQNYFGCLAIASNIGAAWALANYATRNARPKQEPTASATAAKSPAETQAIVPPCRYCIADDQSETQLLNSLSLAALRIETDTLAALHRLGIHTIGQLRQLPRAGMATRLGEQLLMRWDQALGQQSETVVTLHSSPDWSLEHALEYPTENRTTIVELVRRLSHELAQRLARRGEGALRIVCRLDHSEAPPLVLQLGLFRPTNEAAHLESLLVGQLEQALRFQPPAPLWRLCMQATLTGSLVWRQGDLFDNGEAIQRQQIARLVDALSSRLGRKQVLSAQLRRESQPELACSLQPMTGRKPDGGEQATLRKLSSRIARDRGEPTPGDPLRRPSQLFSKPIPIEIRNSQTAAAQTQQLEIQYQGTWHAVTQSSGPERLESGWWRGPSARRDYYRFVTSRGSWWWVYRDLNDNQWYLHGLFD